MNIEIARHLLQMCTYVSEKLIHMNSNLNQENGVKNVHYILSFLDRIINWLFKCCGDLREAYASNKYLATSIYFIRSISSSISIIAIVVFPYNGNEISKCFT